MSTFNRSIPFLGLCLCGLLMSGPASAEIKMGVVNFQKLLEDAPQTKTAMQALENEFAPRRRELLTMQNDLKARDEKLQKEGAVMSETDRAKVEKQLRDQQREFSRKAGEFQDDASTRRPGIPPPCARIHAVGRAAASPLSRDRFRTSRRLPSAISRRAPSGRSASSRVRGAGAQIHFQGLASPSWSGAHPPEASGN